MDYLIRDVTIVDGTGKTPYRGSVLISGERIEHIITDEKQQKKLPRKKRVINGRGKFLSPGFIDIHSHVDWILPDPDHLEALEPLVRQGITTVVTGQCGFSPAPLFNERISDVDRFSDLLCDKPIPLNSSSLNTFLENLEDQGVALNMAPFIGHATLKATLQGITASTKFSIEELARIERVIEESFDAGAFGISFGLGYVPGMYSSRQELQWFTSLVGRMRGVCAVHLKAYSTISPCYPYIPGGTPHNLLALKETIALARNAGAALQISHLIFPGPASWKTEKRVFRSIERAYADGLDISFDAFPYTAGNTTIAAVLPYWFINNFEENIKNTALLRKLRIMFAISKRFLKFDIGEIVLLKAHYEPFEKYEGQNFHAIARDMEQEPLDAYLTVTDVTESKARILIDGYYNTDGHDGLMARVLAHPLCRFETDALITRKGKQNPATYGTFPRIIARLTREAQLMTLEEAIYKMTGATARKMGIQKRGIIAPGNYADLVLFDYEKIQDSDEEMKPAAGIEAVFINGNPVLRDGKLERKKLSGTVLRKNIP